MLINKEKIQHVNSIAHEGKIVVVATDTDGKIWYTVKQDGFEDSYLKLPPAQRTGWEAWEELKFPNETEDQSVLDKEKKELTDQNSSDIYFLRSRYKTHDQSAVAPVQLVSGLGYIYVFRQSKTDTLLVDRFVLDGLTNKLVRKLEVRFKRSRQKYTPSKNQKKGASGLANIDSLDFTDILGSNFYEPTTELNLINHLSEGWFSVVLMPTGEQDKYRWHIFAYNSETAKVEITTLRASDEGLFDVKDYTVLDPELRRIDGIIKRTLDLGNLSVAKGLTAVKYDLQRERQTDDGMQLLRESVRVMLAVGTAAGNVAAISFAVAADGTLSQIADATSEPKKLRRSTTRQILLPLDTLDEIKTIGTANPPPKGTITGLVRGEDDAVIVTSGQSTKIDETEITRVKVTGNQAYNRLYSPVAKIDDNNFEITPENTDGGNWEVVPEEETGLIYNGIVTAYQLTSNGKLRVTAFNHGLESGDQVQVVDTKDYNGNYSVTKIDDKTFSLDGVRWQAGTAINLQAQKRRGVLFNGTNDFIELPDMNHDFSQGITIEAWVWYDAFNFWSRIIDLGNGPTAENIIFGNREGTSNLGYVVVKGNAAAGEASASGALETGKWMHLAATVDASGNAKLYKNGAKVGEASAVSLPNNLNRTRNFIGRSNWATDGFFKGKLSDLRLWGIARTADDIKNSMYLQLTGKELGLVGYWRLDSILEGDERKVIDFSLNGNDGIVRGGAYVSSVTLDRHLDKEGKVEAIKYENEELFAVSERAVYTEEFEFKTDGSGDPKTDKIFAIIYKGKKNRSSDEWVSVAAQPTEITGPFNGWYRARSGFTVPDGVSVVRSFGIGDVKGSWTTLDIRKHQIQLVSDSVTEAKYKDDVTGITSLVNEQFQLQNDLDQLGIKESQEELLLKEKKELEAQINLLSIPRNEAIKNKQAEIDAQQATFNTANAEKNFWDAEYNAARQPIILYQDDNFRGQSLSLGLGRHNIISNFNDKVTSVRVPNGLMVTLYEHEFSGKTLTLKYSSTDVGIAGSINDLTSAVFVKTVNDNVDLGIIQANWIKWQNDVPRMQANLDKLKGELDLLNGLETVRNVKKSDLQKRLDEVNRQLTNVQTELNTFNRKFIAGVKAATSQTLPVLKEKDSRGLVTRGALLGFVRPASRLSALETCEGNVQLSYFDEQGRMRQTNFDATSDSKNPAIEQWIPDSLRTCLNFNNSSNIVTLDTPVNLDEEWTIEAWFAYPLPKTENWNALIGGRDEKLKIAIYTESEHKGESWELGLGTHISDGKWGEISSLKVPEGIKVTLFKPDGANKIIKDEKDQRFVGVDFNDKISTIKVEAIKDNSDRQIIVRREGNTERLGIKLEDGDKFIDSGYDMSDLSPGWHHITAVGEGKDNEAGTTFYIDGKKVGKAKGKSTGNVYAIGNHQHGGQQFGKLAEVRIWGVALSADEIAVNSKTLLTGNEPGLLAYYSFNEATGAAVKNQTGESRNNGTIIGASWWGCAAPIGNLGNQVMKFDGVDNYIELSPESIPVGNKITISFWAKGGNSLPKTGSIIEAKDKDGTRILNIHLPYSDEKIIWDCGDDYRDRILLNAKLNEYKGQWTHWAFTKNAEGAGEMKIYRNGKEWHSCTGFKKPLRTADKCYLGRGLKPGTGYDGSIADVRVWNIVRSESEIKADMNKRLTGKERGLVAYFPLNEIKSKDSKYIVPDLAQNKEGTVNGAFLVPDQNLPIGGSALVSSEYHTVSKDRTAMMRRFFAAPASRGVNLLPDKRVEQLELKWIGNGQFAPTLLGYIEGPPPIPSENLTLEEGYNGATSVELTVSEDVEYKWTRSQDSGLGGAVDIFAGADAETSAGVAVQTQLARVRAGFKGSLDINYQFQNESSISSSSSLSMTDKLQLFGTRERNANFPHLGKRFVPKNIGYALVVSALADVFVTRLQRTGRMIGYQVLPVENIPPDINTITFLINPAYTMSGSLDGMTGSSATSKRFFKHVPEMRAQFGSLYPASYYRLQEAYDLKQQIDQQDKDRQAYFAQFNALLVDETSLNRETNKGDAPAAVGVKREEDKPTKDLTAAEQKAADKEKQENLTKETSAAQDKQSEAVEEKQAELEKIRNENDKSHASASFAGWQRKMEDIQIRAGKRNIVNTYVWDADGGLRSEAQSFASTAEHSIGGAFSLNAGLGFEGKFAGGGTGIELTAQATINLTQTMSKTQTLSRGIQLNVDLSGVESRGITDYNDYPILPGEKVNRYRFMSFYLEGSTNNFTDFFNYVVDPEWLASNSEEARALRQAKGKANKAWRVLHRVTYVERPALMGFGRDVRQLPAAETATDLGQLKAKVEEMQRKLDEILKKLPSK